MDSRKKQQIIIEMKEDVKQAEEIFKDVTFSQMEQLLKDMCDTLKKLCALFDKAKQAKNLHQQHIIAVRYGEMNILFDEVFIYFINRFHNNDLSKYKVMTIKTDTLLLLLSFLHHGTSKH